MPMWRSLAQFHGMARQSPTLRVRCGTLRQVDDGNDDDGELAGADADLAVLGRHREAGMLAAREAQARMEGEVGPLARAGQAGGITRQQQQQQEDCGVACVDAICIGATVLRQLDGLLAPHRRAGGRGVRSGLAAGQPGSLRSRVEADCRVRTGQQPLGRGGGDAPPCDTLASMGCIRSPQPPTTNQLAVGLHAPLPGRLDGGPRAPGPWPLVHARHPSQLCPTQPSGALGPGPPG